MKGEGLPFSHEMQIAPPNCNIGRNASLTYTVLLTQIRLWRTTPWVIGCILVYIGFHMSLQYVAKPVVFGALGQFHVLFFQQVPQHEAGRDSKQTHCRVDTESDTVPRRVRLVIEIR